MGVYNVFYFVVLNDFFGWQLCFYIFCLTFWGKSFKQIHQTTAIEVKYMAKFMKVCTF